MVRVPTNGCLQTAAVDAMTACCSVVGNRDVEPFVPTLISCMARPAEVADGIHRLGAITFVQVRIFGKQPAFCPTDQGFRAPVGEARGGSVADLMEIAGYGCCVRRNIPVIVAANPWLRLYLQIAKRMSSYSVSHISLELCCCRQWSRPACPSWCRSW